MRSQRGSRCSPVLTNLCWNTALAVPLVNSPPLKGNRGFQQHIPTQRWERAQHSASLCSQSHNPLLWRGTSLLCLLPPDEIPILTHSLASEIQALLFARVFGRFFFFNSHHWEGMQPSCMCSEVGTCLQAEAFVLLNPGRLNIPEAQSTASGTKNHLQVLSTKEIFPIRGLTRAAWKIVFPLNLHTIAAGNKSPHQHWAVLSAVTV